MESKKINQLATELTPALSDLTIIGDPSTGISKKITLSQMASLFTGTVEEYPNVAAFPLVGVADTIYIALDTNVLYRWDTGLTSYVELSPNIINSLVFNDANGFDGTISLVGSVATLTITTALTTGSVPFIGASGALTQDNANLFFDDTNNRLGINTNAPTTALDVFGSGIIGRLNGTSTNNAFLGFASAGSNKWSIGNVQSDHRFRIYNEATTNELVSILSTGEFGIGIANPTTKFHIDGGASALIANLDANVSVAKSISFRSDNSNRFNIEVSGTESGSNAGANLFIRRYSDAGALIDTPLTITRSTGSVTLANDLIVDTNTLYVDSTNNRVGIGTSSPINLFHAAGTGRIDTGLYFNNSLTNGAFVWQIANEALRFGTNDTERMRITSSGNVGIGTNNPATTLHAIGSIRSSNSGNTIGTSIGSDGIYTAGSDMFIDSGSNNIRFYAPSERMRITSGGNIFIGTTSSVSSGRMELLIGGNANGSVIGLGNNGNANKVQIVTDSGENMLLVNRSNTPMILYTNDTERMRITNAGRVGIGTTDVDAKFKVFSNDEANLMLATTTKTSVNIVAQKQGIGYAPLIIDAENQQLFISGTEAMRIHSNRRIGIAETNSSIDAKLLVRTDGDAYNIYCDAHNTYSTIYRFMRFRVTSNRTTIGSIDSSDGVNTSYNTTSDYRLKEDLKDFNGLEKLSSIKVYDFKWKGIEHRTYGVLAHELKETLSYAVSGEKDAIDKDGTFRTQGVDYSKIVPILVKAIQELKAEIELLKLK